jgi:hypothetical protein
MPLVRGQIIGHDNERLAFAFSMMSDGETVQCQISDAAMDELAETKGTPSIARHAQFVTHRDTIERIVSDLYDKARASEGTSFACSRIMFRARVTLLERCSDQSDGLVLAASIPISGKQLGTGVGDLHIGPKFVQRQPAQRSRGRAGCAVLVWCAASFEERPVDQLDENAAVLHSLNRVGDLHQLAGDGVGIGEVAADDQLHAAALPG